MKRIFINLFTVFLLTISSIHCPACAAGLTVYFYTPENNTENLALLKTAFDRYLSEQGNYQFQPFDNQKNFEDTLNKKDCIYLLSSWHLNALQQKLPLQVVLLGTFNGSTVQKKMLSTKQDITDFSMLKNAIIAGAGNELYIRNLLQQMDGVKYKEIENTIKILVVPKDLDALGAVGFGMANAAISAESSLKKLEIANPNLHKQLHQIGITEKSLLLVAATLNKPSKDEIALLKILYNMTGTEASLKYLKLLGLDGWQWK
jgi:hypothetical protein